MSLKITPDIPASWHVDLGDGETVEASWHPAAGFSTVYRGKSVYARTLGVLVGTLQDIRHQQQESAARARRLRAAAVNPLPALLYPGFEPVGVREIGEQTPYALITRQNGVKDKVAPGSLLRTLTPDERTGIEHADDAVAAAHAAVAEMMAVTRYTAEDHLDREVVVTFDPERDVYVADLDGEELTYDNLRMLEAQVKDRLIRQRWPFAVIDHEEDGGIVTAVVAAEEYDDTAEADLYGSDGLFETREQAEEYLRRSERLYIAQDGLAVLLQEYRFDDSVFRSESA